VNDEVMVLFEMSRFNHQIFKHLFNRLHSDGFARNFIRFATSFDWSLKNEKLPKKFDLKNSIM